MRESFLKDYSKRMAFVGQRVMLSSGQGKQWNGMVLGVKEDGQLRLRLADGAEAGFPIGELRLRPEG